MAEEVKCPQCGGNCCVCEPAKVEGEWDTWWVHCQDCDLQLKNYYHTREMAVGAWLSTDPEYKDGWNGKGK